MENGYSGVDWIRPRCRSF